jgi:hypothetical protein
VIRHALRRFRSIRLDGGATAEMNGQPARRRLWRWRSCQGGIFTLVRVRN